MRCELGRRIPLALLSHLIYAIAIELLQARKLESRTTTFDGNDDVDGGGGGGQLIQFARATNAMLSKRTDLQCIADSEIKYAAHSIGKSGISVCVSTRRQLSAIDGARWFECENPATIS